LSARVGRFEVEIDVFGGVTASVKTLVVPPPPGGELPPEGEPGPEVEAETSGRAEAGCGRGEAPDINP
jgi:hypothetical protein